MSIVFLKVRMNYAAPSPQLVGKLQGRYRLSAISARAKNEANSSPVLRIIMLRLSRFARLPVYLLTCPHLFAGFFCCHAAKHQARRMEAQSINIVLSRGHFLGTYGTSRYGLVVKTPRISFSSRFSLSEK
jgi:hypothetical protein